MQVTKNDKIRQHHESVAMYEFMAGIAKLSRNNSSIEDVLSRVTQILSKVPRVKKTEVYRDFYRIVNSLNTPECIVTLCTETESVKDAVRDDLWQHFPDDAVSRFMNSLHKALLGGQENYPWSSYVVQYKRPRKQTYSYL